MGLNPPVNENRQIEDAASEGGSRVKRRSETSLLAGAHTPKKVEGKRSAKKPSALCPSSAASSADPRWKPW